MLVLDGFPIRHVGLGKSMLVSDEVCWSPMKHFGLRRVSDQACLSPIGLQRVSDLACWFPTGLQWGPIGLR